MDSGFLELNSGFQSPGFQIPQVKILPDPESGFPYNGASLGYSKWNQNALEDSFTETQLICSIHKYIEPDRPFEGRTTDLQFLQNPRMGSGESKAHSKRNTTTSSNPSSHNKQIHTTMTQKRLNAVLCPWDRTAFTKRQSFPNRRRSLDRNFRTLAEVAEGGGYSITFYTASLRPEVQPLTLLYTIFDRKGTPLIYHLLINGTLFTLPV